MHLAPTASATVVVLRLFYVKGMVYRKMTNYSLLSQWPCYPVLGLTVRAFSCQYLSPLVFTIPLVSWWLKPSGSLTWCSREGFVLKGVNRMRCRCNSEHFSAFWGMSSDQLPLISRFLPFLTFREESFSWAAHLHIWALSSPRGKTLEPQKLI